MIALTPTKRSLLDTFSDGLERDGRAFGAGTLSWAKKAGYVEQTQETPRRYRITEAGRDARNGR